MTLEYANYEGLNIDEELEKIKKCSQANINLDPTDKKCLFYLGMLFANGVPINITNMDSVDFSETNKSFAIMPYVWSKMGDKSYPPADFDWEHETDLHRLIENVKRAGARLERVESRPIAKKIFLICPVRRATPEQKKWIEDFTARKEQEGYKIHAPHIHTRQVDMLRGYAICRQNEEAVATSEEIDLYYDQSSTGSVFDLGAAYALHKPLRLLNRDEITFNPNDFMDQLIENWPFNKRSFSSTEELKESLKKAWTQETCSPGLKDVWSVDNPSLGQCAITALIVNEEFGGDIMRCMSPTGSHYYNLIDGKIVDLTKDQFLGQEPEYAFGAVRTREYLLGNEDTKNRYQLLKRNLQKGIPEEKGNQYCKEQ